MKAMNAKSMTKGGIAEALSTSTETKKSVCGQILNSLAEIATQEVKSTGVFTIPGYLQNQNPSKASNQYWAKNFKCCKASTLSAEL